jgi:hypothetical protein
VFVSYAHADDVPMDAGVPGWVSLFVDKLKRAVARQAGGASIEFWMDHRLEPQRRVDDELRRRIRDSVVILSFVSPRYLESEWCGKEIATFVAEVGHGIASNRVFMVEVLPTRRDKWHSAVQDLTAIPLWTESLTHPEPRTKGWPVPDPRGDRDFWDDVNYLAGVLARQLQGLDTTDGGNGMLPLQSVQATAAPPDPAPADTPPDTPASEVLTIVVHAADDENRQLVGKTQELLGELDADAYLAPVISPGQTPAQHRAAVEQMLRTSHGVLVVYGAAPPSWVQSKHAEVRKLLALERRGTWTGLLEGPPETKLPHGLPPRGLMVLDCRNGPSKEELGRFVQALRQQRDIQARHV